MKSFCKADRTGDLTLRATTISGGLASAVGFPRGDSGGGAFVQGGTLTLTNATLSGNTASFGGGVRTHQLATVTLTNSTVSGNTALDGGGVFTISATTTLANSTISGNSAGNRGGGLFNSYAPMILTNSTVSGNSAGTRGGGVYNAFGPMSLRSSTVTGNRAEAKGGGVYNGGVVGSFRSEVDLLNSLISGNTAPLRGAEVYQSAGGVVNAYAFNLFGHSGLTNAQAFFGYIVTGAIDIIATSDRANIALPSILNPTLANNGGLTQTHALPAGSPAVDEAGGGPLNDQRGVPRPQDGNDDGVAYLDIGTFERVRPGAVTCDGLPATIIGTTASQTLTGTAGVDVIQVLGSSSTPLKI